MEGGETGMIGVGRAVGGGVVGLGVKFGEGVKVNRQGGRRIIS